MTTAKHLALGLVAPRRWGGRRRGAGRKPTHERPGMSHAARELHDGRHPAHVTLRVRAGVPSRRIPRIARAFEQSLAQACERDDFRVAQYSLQRNHLHLIVEADDRGALARGMIAVGSRLARAVNRVCRRRGPVVADRYHVRALRSPREVWNALRYVLNCRRHDARALGLGCLDPASSARWFDGWSASPVSGAIPEWLARPVARARTWLLGVGWRRYGGIDCADVPGPRRKAIGGRA